MIVQRGPENEGSVTLPERPTPPLQLATARQRSDGTIETCGPTAIGPDEVIPAKRKWMIHKDAEGLDFDIELENSIKSLKRIIPPCESAEKAIENRIRRLRRQYATYNPRPLIWLLVHSHELRLQKFGIEMANALFGDDKAFLLVDCAKSDFGYDKLWGTPPGYKGHLDGGVITNQLIIRPESLIVIANFEYADSGTLEGLGKISERGTQGIARGGKILKVSGEDAIFVLATTRSSSYNSAGSKQLLMHSLRVARPELKWDLLYEINRAEVLVWN